MTLPPHLAEVLRAGAQACGSELVFTAAPTLNNLSIAARDPLARQCEVLFGQPNPLDVIESKSLEWAHLNTAGYTKYDTDEMRSALKSRGAVMTNSSSVYAEPCALQLLSFIVARARRTHETFQSQQIQHWDYARLRPMMRIVDGETALLVGFGAIGRRVAEMLGVLRMKVTAVRRSVRGDESVPAVSIGSLDEVLPHADHVINSLPASDSTRALFIASRFARMRPGATFYNVGRGDTVDHDALRDALVSNHLGAAYLDVTAPEPLPDRHPLWTTPNCYISPHVAGGAQNELRRLIDHFLGNLTNWSRGEQLIDRIV